MNKILVTGASGNLGKKTLVNLLKRRPASQLVGLAPDPENTKDMQDLGIEIRRGDYLDPASLRDAFAGVEKVMLIAAPKFVDRRTAHVNVIEAAAKAGVKHLVYMPFNRKTDHKLMDLTQEDKDTETKLKSSGINYTIVHHPPFLDMLPFFLGPKPWETGVVIPAGEGNIAAASQDDLAEAHAVVLTEPGHENKTYKLNGYPGASFAEIAKILSRIHGKEVAYKPISREAYVQNAVGQGLPQGVADLLDALAHTMNIGEWDYQTNDLERLIGHKPKSHTEFFTEQYKNANK